MLDDPSSRRAFRAGASPIFPDQPGVTHGRLPSSPAKSGLRPRRLAAFLLAAMAVAGFGGPLPSRTSAHAGPTPAACAGDCDADEVVGEADLDAGVRELFAAERGLECAALLRDAEAPPNAGDLVAAVTHAAGCGAVPLVAGGGVYRTYPGFEIRMPVEAEDPDGRPLRFRAADLPAGAELDPDAGILHWTPGPRQIGPFEIPITVAPLGYPADTAEVIAALKVAPMDACTIADCDPESGCTSALAPLGGGCCAAGTVTRVAEPDAECPDGAVLFTGRNMIGFGRLQNCDRQRLLVFSQAGVFMRLHVEARCVRSQVSVTVHTRLETLSDVHTDRQQAIVLQPRGDGFAERLNLSLPVDNATMALEGQEADLTVTLTDAGRGVVLTEKLRIILTHERIGDLPDL